MRGSWCGSTSWCQLCTFPRYTASECAQYSSKISESKRLRVAIFHLNSLIFWYLDYMDFRKTNTCRVCCPQDCPGRVKGKKTKQTKNLFPSQDGTKRLKNEQFSSKFSYVHESRERMWKTYKGTCCLPLLSPLFLDVSLGYDIIWVPDYYFSLIIFHPALPSYSCHFHADIIIE